MFFLNISNHPKSVFFSVTIFQSVPFYKATALPPLSPHHFPKDFMELGHCAQGDHCILEQGGSWSLSEAHKKRRETIKVGMTCKILANSVIVTNNIVV